jgi:hypothetical protein
LISKGFLLAWKLLIMIKEAKKKTAIFSVIIVYNMKHFIINFLIISLYFPIAIFAQEKEQPKVYYDTDLEKYKSPHEEETFQHNQKIFNKNEEQSLEDKKYWEAIRQKKK